MMRGNLNLSVTRSPLLVSYIHIIIIHKCLDLIFNICLSLKILNSNEIKKEFFIWATAVSHFCMFVLPVSHREHQAANLTAQMSRNIS